MISTQQRRVRLESLHPSLPPFKIWFSLPIDGLNVESFKKSLCQQLPALKDATVSPDQLILEIDGFELLGESTIDLVRETDIITLKRRDCDTTKSLKRKGDGDTVQVPPQKRIKLAISSDSESSSSTSTSTSSDSSSDSDSDSDTSDTSSTSIPSKLVVSNAKSGVKTVKAKTVVSSMPTRNNAQVHTVPPGAGKPSTQSRNKRRKIKRQSARSANTTQNLASGDAVVPGHVRGTEEPSKSPTKQDGITPATESLTPSQYETVMPTTTLFSSLGNKNKSKGFKTAMQNAAPKKIVFSENKPQRVYVIPPSEREDLPPNIFVTSVDVEWRTDQSRSSSQYQCQDVTLPDSHSEEVAQTSQTPDRPGDGIDWATVEQQWSQYPTLDHPSIKNLSSTHIVAWKAFGLDPVSLTPQASILHIARVVEVTDQSILVSLLVRPGTGQVAFGRASFDADSPEEEEPASFSLTEVLDWKLVTPINN